MKKLLLITITFLLTAGSVRAEYPLGVSLGMVKVPEPEKLAQIKAAGIDHVEVVFNYFWRNAPENECYTRAYRVKALLEEAGLKVWSCHLPFSRQLDISVPDPALREQNSANSIGRLALSAKEIGPVLCIENLPRTCLGRDSGELMRLIADYPEVMVCFDSNHLLKEEHAHFFEAVGNRIGTIHASDYDRKDERHWLPGEGVIDWPDFLRRLQASGYKGVFMHEVRAGVNPTKRLFSAK